MRDQEKKNETCKYLFALFSKYIKKYVEMT